MSQTITGWLNRCPLPKLEARMLLQHCTGLTRAQLVTRGSDVLDASTLQTLDALAERRCKGEPMAYILGSREFYGRLFHVNPHVLIPRPETEHLVEAVLEYLPKGGKVWDLGTGSGAIAVTVALERPDAAVRASDVSPQALNTAEHNARRLGADIKWAAGSWFEAGRPSEYHAYDIVVSNPPYIEAEDRHLHQGDLRFEPQTALTDFSDGLSCIRILAAGAGMYLKPGGMLMIEHGYDQGAAVRAIFEQNGFESVETRQDLAGLDRLTLGRIGYLSRHDE
ncbi:peptide chain release factor N(5)-glutamine methyltransferase [Neisseria dumasiana]|uniref:peptide chain release factor N(5)-glutamine methyltransferase n=1 Tax=Neisseria dumasiana TaxID=1931275 RepID=UPI000A18C5C2|nr:peptide chain release factor N(5)-glutamine methyltransferase [Neisseria dumasiana]OSI15980.1 protein-(glutamine-N5) methyltransferase, release factor-specific [Neisseria dumasiana]